MVKTVAQARTVTSAMRFAHAVTSAVSRFLTTAMNANSIANDVHKLNALTDTELEALGTTRSAEIDRIFSLHGCQ